jgi:cardiolipin synthase
MPLNLPNILTWLRIILIPAIVGIFYLPAEWLSEWEMNLLATVLFTAAAITDWLDGYLARRLNQTSAFGAFLDPVADKLMVAAALILLVRLDRVDAAVAIIIIGREIAISALREWMAKIGESKSVAVSLLGKIKTGFQMFAIPMLLYNDRIGSFDPHQVGTWLIYMAALLTIVSMFYYLILAGRPTGRPPQTKHSVRNQKLDRFVSPE